MVKDHVVHKSNKKNSSTSNLFSVSLLDLLVTERKRKAVWTEKAGISSS